MHKLKIFLQTKPVFLYLLSLFFVLHGFTENYPYVPVKIALILLLKYLFASLLLLLAFWLCYKNVFKASLLAFCIMSYNFFFGKGYDFLSIYFSNTFIVNFTFILIFTVIVFLLIFLLLKSAKKNLSGIHLYLNCLILLLTLIDAAILAPKLINRRDQNIRNLSYNLKKCTSCFTPDIYFIILDEYAGKQQLMEQFSFDNSDFERNLRNRGFKIINNSISNYNLTSYSMAACMNMTYINNLRSTGVNKIDEFRSIDIIEQNNMVSFFKKNGYHVYNHSIFDLRKNPKPVESPFLSSREDLITFQTFAKRVRKSSIFDLIIPGQKKQDLNQTLSNNLKIEGLTRKVVSKKDTIPKFVYTHLVMPHYFYYFDSSGKSVSQKELISDAKNKNSYLQYLVYTNKKVLNLIDYIKNNAPEPPIIVLMSDHGFRQTRNKNKEDNKYHFMNLNSIFLPNGNYSGFYEGMSNVNQFRVILNSQFGQNLPLLKDSSSFIWH